ncbi:unnamed protein product [Camellia sinensis]
MRPEEKKLVAEINRTAKIGNEINVASQLLTSPKGRIASKMTKDAKRKRNTFKALCTMDDALCVRASPSLPHTMDGASSPNVSRMKQKRKKKTFKAPCTMDEALCVRG